MINDYGLEKVEKYLTLYNQNRRVAYGHVDFLLNMINQFLVEFDSQRAKLPIEIDELKSFLQCFCVFRRSGLSK